MGALVGVIGLVKLGVRNVDVELRGDSSRSIPIINYTIHVSARG